MKKKQIMVGTLTVAAIACLFACKGNEEASQRESLERLELRLSGQEVHRVELDVPYTTTNMKGQKRQYSEAFIVLLKLEYPPFRGPAVEFFIGDYRVPEFGGWREGVYFKVYDPELLTQLTGQEMRYRIPDHEIQSFNETLKVPPLKDLIVLPEKEILRGSGR